MASGENHYKADLQDFYFRLFEQFQIGDILGQGRFADWGEDEVKMVLEETYRFACEVTGPLNAPADAQGCRVVDGRVITPDGFKNAWKRIYETGTQSLSMEERYNGQDAPATVHALTEELLTGSNTALLMYTGFGPAAAELILKHGDERQKSLFAERMCSGTWGGTMCLTEPHAGSDVGSATTSATPVGDGRYKIKGSKIFITAGDHDLAENIIHLVLARIEGAPVGTKGLSLFIVPATRVDESGKMGERNDVTLASIEHKMGLNGSATCALNFGENDECYGELVGGKEHQGMRQMFTLMNRARIAVGIQGLAIMSSAYLNALEYAKERKQGSDVKNWKDASAERVAIIRHPNIRRDLLWMKSVVEGTRALAIKLTTHQDRAELLRGKDDEGVAYHEGQVDLLTPLLKAYASDMGFAVCERAIQVLGGAGFLKDYPLEQYARDCKIFSIYEGTNAIQALDLVGRKLGQAGGKNAQAFMAEVQKFVATHKEHEELGPSVVQLGKAVEAVAGAAMKFLGWAQAGKMEHVPLHAETFLQMMAETTVGWLLLEGAAIASEKLPSASGDKKAVYEGKRATGVFFANNVLPSVIGKAKMIQADDSTALSISDAAFA